LRKFILYRILGNDLPPRHVSGKTQEHLRYFLNQEPELPHCEKRWVINRVVDQEQEAAMLELLQDHGQHVVHLPFDLNAFKAIPSKDRDERIRYVMNNNGARNTAIQDGISDGGWVLPLDGSCCWNLHGWSQFLQAVSDSPRLRYIVIPMHRGLDGQDFQDPDFTPELTEAWTLPKRKIFRRKMEGASEPQLAFRQDAPDRFNEAMVYGRTPKVELLWRLGVDGVWRNFQPALRHQAMKNKSAFYKKYISGGYVCRLFSGNTQAEENHRLRHRYRQQGIDQIFEELERR